MSKPDDGPGGGTREGLIGDIFNKVKDILADEDPEQDPTHPDHPDNRADPELLPPTTPPMCQHDSESLSPPPVGGSVA